MPYNNYSHIPFILKPATDIVKEAVWSLNATKGGIEVYPLCGYLLHSLFLKLTGAQEQKLKCICWELACRDYEYRYERFGRDRLGECSDFDDKNKVYNDLLNEIRKFDEGFAVSNDVKDDILNDWQSSTQQLFDNSIIAICFKKKYDDYLAMASSVSSSWIMSDNQLFTNKSNITQAEKVSTCGLALLEIYKKYVYTERNRCAHNTRSYQHNLPTLKSMMSEDYKLQNYFLYMSVMLLLDKIYVKLFNVYLDKVK